MAEILCPLCCKIVTFDKICECLFSKNCKNAYLLPKLKDFDKKNSKNDEAIDGFNEQSSNKTRKLYPEYQKNYSEEAKTLNERKNENKKRNYISCGGHKKNRKFRYLTDETSNNEQLQDQCNNSHFGTKSHFCKNEVYSDVVPVLRSSESVELDQKFGNDSNSKHKMELISTGISSQQNMCETYDFTSTDKLSGKQCEMSCKKNKGISFSVDTILSKTFPNVVSQKIHLDPENNFGTTNFLNNPKFSKSLMESNGEAYKMSEKPTGCSILQQVAPQFDSNKDNSVAKLQESIESLKPEKILVVISERHANFSKSENRRRDFVVGNQEFDLKSNLDYHQTQTIGKAFECDKHKKLPQQWTISRHFNAPSPNYSFLYGNRQKVFSCKETNEPHKRTHTGGKPFACEVCKKGFSLKYRLNRHYQVHTNEKPFVCKVCEKRFKRKCHLSSHYRIHTNEKPFVCDICEKRFTRVSDLNRHNRVHTNEKPYACGMCDKRFTQKYNLKIHYRIHTNE